MQTARHEQILNHLSSHRWLSVDDAITLFDASPATLRRDFNALAKQGLVERVRGGIHAVTRESMQPWSLRQQQSASAKTAIAERAASMVREHDVVMIDGGTTTAFMGDTLPEIPLRVITNSIALATLLNARNLQPIHLYLTGGRLFPGGALLLGPDATASIDNYEADVAFLSASGITAGGIYNTGDQVSEFQRRMISRASKIVVLVDGTKIGKKDMCRVAPLEKIDVVITDHGADLSIFKDTDLEVVTVKA